MAKRTRRFKNLSNSEVYDAVRDFAKKIEKEKAFIEAYGTREEYVAQCGGDKA